MQEGFKEYFSDQTEIEQWESIYHRQDFRGFCYRARMNQALSWLDASNLSSNAMTLDAGCGAGIITREIAKRGHKIIGIDHSYGMIENAHSVCNADRNLKVKFSQADVESLPFKDSSLDMILCLGVITYLESEQEALREFSRVLKPGGVLILSSLNTAHLVVYLDLPILVGNILDMVLDFARNTVKKTLGSRIATRAATWKKSIATRKKRAEIKTSSPRYRRYLTPKLKTSLELQGFSVLEYTTVPLGLLTFGGRTIPPQRLNIKMTMFLERFSNVPLVGPLGGMCIFRVRKSPMGRPTQSSHLKPA